MESKYRGELCAPGQKVTSQAAKRSWAITMLKNPLLWIVLILLCATAIDYASAASEASTLETQMNKDYSISWVRLGQYFTNGKNALLSANANRDALDKIMTDVLHNKYGNANALRLSSNGVYTVIANAYPNDPDIKSVANVYTAARDILIGGYDDYSNQVVRLQNDIQQFDNWQHGGDGNMLEKPFLGGYPDSELQAQYAAGAHFYHSTEALDQMRQIIADPGVAASYQSGTLQPIQFPTP